MGNQDYRVVFSGQFDSKRSISEIRKDLMGKYTIAEDKFALFMLGRPLVIKFGLSRTDANAVKSVMERLGLICYVEPIPDKKDFNFEGLIERRKSDRRLIKERRLSPRISERPSSRRVKERRHNWSADSYMDLV